MSLLTAGREQRRALEVKRQQAVLRRLERRGDDGATEAELERWLEWPTGTGAVLRSLAEDGLAHARDGRWYPGPALEGATILRLTPPPKPDAEAAVLAALGTGTKSPTAVAMLAEGVPMSEATAAVTALLARGVLERCGGDRVRRVRDGVPAARPKTEAEAEAIRAARPKQIHHQKESGGRQATPAPEDATRAAPSGRGSKQSRTSTARRGARRDRGPARLNGNAAQSPRADQVLEVLQRFPQGAAPHELAAELPGVSAGALRSALYTLRRRDLARHNGELAKGSRWFPTSAPLAVEPPRGLGQAPVQGGALPALEAQQVEHPIRNRAAAGSTPAEGSLFPEHARIGDELADWWRGLSPTARRALSHHDLAALGRVVRRCARALGAA